MEFTETRAHCEVQKTKQRSVQYGSGVQPGLPESRISPYQTINLESRLQFRSGDLHLLPPPPFGPGEEVEIITSPRGFAFPPPSLPKRGSRGKLIASSSLSLCS
ncbi:hypothetical protein NPIL_156781 [Nephila pilipes]|uniref:Uncharacterized protein n=1 Tax=Nephila pilipes TaxID=299642 RepID=A0A8X6NPZ0_NEPPI|nr:hypothetical protein NPIL_156781 [Nephila pilipes]